MCFQVLLEHSLSAALGVYGGLCLLAACLAFFLPIETKGREMAVSQARDQLTLPMLTLMLLAAIFVYFKLCEKPKI